MDVERRKFLKIILIGSGTFLVGRVFGPLFSKFLDDSSIDPGSKTKADPVAFHVIKNKDKLSFYDDSGDEVFQIDNGV